MKIFRFDASTGQPIEQFGSANVILSHITRLAADARVSCVYLAPEGKIGYHQAHASQLFLVVHGEGAVKSGSDSPVRIIAGYAAYWEKNEWHESQSNTGLTAIVIEGDPINPAEFMLPVQ